MSLRRALALALLLPVAAACGDRGTAPADDAPAPVRVRAALAGSAVAWLSVEVTGSGIGEPVVVTLPASGTTASGTTASGTVAVPAGPARTFTARGFDLGGTLTHRAAATADVRPGRGATVALSLLPTSSGPGSSTGEHVVAIDGGDVALEPGATRRLTATVTASGAPLPGAVVTWATLDPRVATVSTSGLVSAIAAGTTQVLALSGGGAATVGVVVQ